MKTISIFLTCVFFSSIINAQPDPKQILTQSTDSILKLEYFSYTAELKNRYMSDNDTFKNTVDAWFKKELEDTWAGAKSKLIYDTNYIYIYDLSLKYSINYLTKNIYIEDPNISKRGFGAGNWISNALFSPLFQQIPFEASLNKTSKQQLLEDQTFDGKKCWVVLVSYEDNEVKNRTSKIYIDQLTYIPLRMVVNLDWQDMHQYSEISLYNFKIEDESIESVFQIDTLNPEFTKTYFNPKDWESPPLLEINTIAPNFKAKLFQADSINLTDIKGKVYLLDFWYSSCGPCLMAMPALQSLHEKYQEKGLVVIGINPYDGSNKAKMEKMPEFLEYRNISYKLLFTDREMPKKYRVTAYPSIYILNQNFEIIFTDKGYGDGVEKQWEKVIKKELKK